jgi:predicted nicotinamide N-methyase
MVIRPFSFPYETSIREIEVGGIALEVECLRDLDATIDAHFKEYERTGRAELFEELCPYFGNPWPAGLALADFVSEKSAELQGKTVLELGCGLALPSLVLARSNISVDCFDLHPDAGVFLEKNAFANKLEKPHFECRDWKLGLEKRYDCILGSDVLYDRTQAPTLLSFLETHLVKGGQALIADPGRPYLESFLREAKERGWQLLEEGRRGVLIACLRKDASY